VENIEGSGFKVMLPRVSNWTPPEEINFDEISGWTSEMRAELMKKRDAWWFSNPRPADFKDLSNGYIRFDVKKQDLKLGRRKYSVQHVVEVASSRRLEESLTT